jgi:phosphomevalonate kinase
LLVIFSQEANADVANALWREINACNEVVQECVQGLHKQSIEDILHCGQIAASEWATSGPAGETLLRLREAFVGARRGLKRMGELAGVPIEPDSQTRLCDASMAVPGVVCCGVPGAGGEDAVVALVVAGSGKLLQETWHKWTEARVLPMLVTQDPRGVVVIRQAH